MAKKQTENSYIVKCDCPTPLAHNPCQLLAPNEEAAIDRFMRRNGINGTDHKITVADASEGFSPPEGGEAAAKKKDDEVQAAAEKEAAEKKAAAEKKKEAAAKKKDDAKK